MRDPVGVAILCTSGQLSFAKCWKSGTPLSYTLLASFWNLPCSLETISDFLQTRKFIRNIKDTFFEVSFPNFQIIWWHSSSSSKFWFLSHFSLPMDMQGLGGSEELRPLPKALFFPPRNSNLTDWEEQGGCPGTSWNLWCTFSCCVSSTMCSAWHLKMILCLKNFSQLCNVQRKRDRVRGQKFPLHQQLC